MPSSYFKIGITSLKLKTMMKMKVTSSCIFSAPAAAAAATATATALSCTAEMKATSDLLGSVKRGPTVLSCPNRHLDMCKAVTLAARTLEIDHKVSCFIKFYY